MGVHTAERKQVMRALAKARKLVEDFKLHGALMPKLMVAGQWTTPAQLVAGWQPMFAAATRAEATKVALDKDLADRDALVLPKRTHLDDVAAGVRTTLGTRHVALANFGIPTVGKRRKLTQAEEAIAGAKRRNTRGVRGTLGRKQRKDVTAAAKPGLAVVDASGKIVAAPLPHARPGKPRGK